MPETPRLSARVLAADEPLAHGTVLSAEGEIDLGTACMLRQALAPVLEHHTGPVVVDLSRVAFMDSTGVHVLMDALRRLEPQNRALALVCPEGGPVDLILHLVDLLDDVTVYRSCESAVGGGDDLAPVLH